MNITPQKFDEMSDRLFEAQSAYLFGEEPPTIIGWFNMRCHVFGILADYDVTEEEYENELMRRLTETQ